MTNLLGRFVSQVRLHSTTHATGIGNIGPNISKDLGGKKGGATLEVVEQGILVTVGTIQVVIPTGNIVSYELEPVKSASLNEKNSRTGADSAR